MTRWAGCGRGTGVALAARNKGAMQHRNYDDRGELLSSPERGRNELRIKRIEDVFRGLNFLIRSPRIEQSYGRGVREFFLIYLKNGGDSDVDRGVGPGEHYMNSTSLPNDGSMKSDRHPKSAAREYLEAFGFALIIALVMRASIVQAYVIPTGSMIPRSAITFWSTRSDTGCVFPIQFWD